MPIREIVEVETESSSYVSPSFENASEKGPNFLG
jgi:hypothetical protein